MKIRILFVIENSSFGGGERAFAQIINGLDKEKFEVYVVCLPDGLFVEKIKNTAQIIPLDLRNRFNLLNIFLLAKVIKGKKIDIVHSQGARADFFTRLAGRLAKVSKVVSTVAMPVEGFDVGFFKKGIYIVLDRYTEKFVDKFVVVSDALRKRLIEKHRIPSEKVSLIYNGVEINSDTGYRIPDARKKIIQELQIPENTMLVGTIGRLVWQKGLPYFIEAIEIIETRYKIPDTGYLIVGEGNLERSLKLKVESLKLDNKIIFTGFRKDVKEILAALDIFVLPSIREGQPIILLEAMAMAKPIIATNIEGVNETVIDGETGILVPPKNPQALAEAILRLTQDKELRKKMGLAGRKLVEEKFDIREIVKQHEQLYFTLVSGERLTS